MSRCMIVEKSSVVRKVAKRILASPDRFIVEASSAAEAITLCQSHMPDCIVVEANPADMELEDFIRDIRAMEAKTEPMIIVALVEMDLVRMTRAKRAGADDYLLKPFDRPQLLARFKQFERRAA